MLPHRTIVRQNDTMLGEPFLIFIIEAYCENMEIAALLVVTLIVFFRRPFAPRSTAAFVAARRVHRAAKKVVKQSVASGEAAEANRTTKTSGRKNLNDQAKGATRH